MAGVVDPAFERSENWGWDMPNKVKYTKEGANRLFDYLLRTYKIRNDSALAAELGISRPGLSKIRSGFVGMGDTVVLSVHDVFEIPIKDIKRILNEHAMV